MVRTGKYRGVYFDKKTYELVRQAANYLGLPLSTFIRYAALKYALDVMHLQRWLNNVTTPEGNYVETD